MNWFTQAFILLCGIFVTEAGYGVVYSGPEAQSDVQAPAYMPSYLKNQRFTKTYGGRSYGGTKTVSYGGTKTAYGGTKTAYGGTKNAYGGTKTAYGGTKTAYGGTKTAYGGTKTAYGGANNGYGGHPSRYSEAKSWSSSSNEEPSYEIFLDNANQPYQPKCVPECKNSGICVDTNTCQCPENYQGRYCEFERRPCLNSPPPPMNSNMKCAQDQCTIQCIDGHKFPDGSTLANMRCVEGQWQPARADFTSIPDCVPECDPPCLNGGVCLALNVCSCPVDYRGPQCQYSASACDMSKLSFNGGVKCAGDSDKTTCRLSCPAGADWSSTPAQEYTCLYATGQYEPQPIPHCVFTDVVVISPSHSYNTSYYSISESSVYSSNNNSIENLYGAGSHSRVDGYGNSVKVVVQDLTPKGGTCLTWAGAHYKTFDGKVYTFQSPCQHILLRDPTDHRYTVAIQQRPCKRPSYCPSELTVYLEEKPYVLTTGEDGSVIFRNSRRLIPIPAALPGLRVSMPGDYVIVNLDSAGITLMWDTNTLVQIDGSVLLWNNTEGLCGTLDGNPENDLTTKSGQVVKSVSVLAASWQLNKLGDICESSAVEANSCADETAATRFCSDLISRKKFRKCSAVMDVLQFIETCKWDYCACAATMNSEDCACRAISVYAKECLRHGIEEARNWRDPDTCPMKCPEGKLYKSCGPESQASCAFPHTSAKEDNSTCVEGCFCPAGLLLEAGRCVPPKDCPCRLRNKTFKPGDVISKDCNKCTCNAGEWACTSAACGARCRAVGDPHYSTFDGLRYDFMGRCSYTMLQADDVTVTVDNVACSGAISEEMNLTPTKTTGKPSCTKAVTLNYNGVSVHLSQGGVVAVNGKEVTSLPVMAGDVKIRAASSLFLIVQLPNKVDLWWDGNTRVFIDVPAEFRDKTKGLCGTFNANQKDDFLTPESDIEQSTLAFANKWRTRELCEDSRTPEPDHPCKANVERKEKAEEYCAKLKSTVFEACHWHVDVEPYYESCLYDMCACEGDGSRCLCAILGDYADSCARAGVLVQWRYNVQECELQCTGGQEYTVCADSCLRKCSDTAFSTTCSPSCVEGCACPAGQLLDDNGVCVPVALCPCQHKGLQFKAGYKEVRPGSRERELCTCVGARWDCKPTTPAEIKRYPPAEDLRSNCSATRNMDYTSCARAEPLTCKNMHLPPSPTSSECRPGCECKAGFVLDVASKRCVTPEQCPCHHGGHSYPDGHVMTEECNTCECKRGNWTCTDKQCAGVCSAWGDSHVTTFDGTDYDFEGVCTYLLAKGNTDGDGFSVEIQNVPCGTTGATCSKSITLKVGSGAQEEIVSLTKNGPMPDIALLKRVKVRVAGAYVFLDVPALGVSVQWDHLTRVYVKLQPMWKGRVKGLCGNYNADMRDDFQTPSGGGLAEASALIFADSWKLKSTCPMAQEAIDHCKERPSRKQWSTSTCSVLKQYPFTLCHGEVPPHAWVTRCERDACACDAGGDGECACAALAAYATECVRRGVKFNWRKQELCPMQCDMTCSNYDCCVPPCPPETCDNTLQYQDIKATCEKDVCVEGCKLKKPCTDGLVYKNSSASECVPRALCRPPCMKLDNGTEVPEGGVVSEDDCHTCRCSKNQVVCTGEPCTTTVAPIPSVSVQPEEPTKPKPQDEPLKCVPGWTPWISRGVPETEANGTLEKEPLPAPNELPIGSPMCKPDMMTDIQCRTIDTQQTAKETGVNVECSLERGLVCKEKGILCPDFEIRVLCTCQEPNPCENITTPTTKHPTDCAKFYECAPSGPVLKDCGPGTLYNPVTYVCDWPASVALVRPECGTTTLATPGTTVATPSTPVTTPGTPVTTPGTPVTTSGTPVTTSGIPVTTPGTPVTTPGVVGVTKSESNPCFNITTPNTKHPTDCAKFYECSPSGPVLKDCGPGTLYNPVTYVCDWPASVALVRPECGTTTLATLGTTVATPGTTLAPPIAVTTPEAATSPACPPGKVFRPCAYPCDKLCDHFKRTLMDSRRCIREKCVEGCVDASIACDYGSYWRDENTCVPKKHCTCMSDGQVIKPGGVVVDGCLKCQCLDNDFHCDSTECVAVNIPTKGSTHESYIMRTTPYTTTHAIPTTTHGIPTTHGTPTTPHAIPTTTHGIPTTTHAIPTTTHGLPTTTPISNSATPGVIVTSTTTLAPKFNTTSPSTITPGPIIPPTAPEEPRVLIVPSNKVEILTILPEIVTTTVTPLIVKSTSSPPPECAPDNYIDLMWGDEPLPDSAFKASSTLDDLHQPQFAVLNGHALDITEGSWNPSPSDRQPLIQVSLPHRQPIYGVYLQGAPVSDQYVTTYKVLYGDDGHTFAVVSTPDGNAQVFRGPIDHDTVSKQMFTPPIEAQHIRVEPLTWHNSPAVRMELIGCQLPLTTPATTVTPEPILCDEPLGIAADLPLASITTSSNPEDKQFLTLDGTRGWRPLYSTPGEWIMFNFTSPRNITGVKTKGGDLGWVTAFKVAHSNDLQIFSPVVNKDLSERIFPANYDSASVMEHHFIPPIRAQYLKLLPIKWKDNIELRAEPIGCFEPYPTVPPPAPSPPPPPPPCQLCPSVTATVCACAADLYYDGESCVPRTQCPCLESFMPYPVGSTFRGANCDECVCKLGGVTDCKPSKKCTCDETSSVRAEYQHLNRSELVPRLDAATCACECEPCGAGARKCSDGICLPEQRFCDGVADCSDDELHCATEPTVATEKAPTAAFTPRTTSTTPTTPTTLPTTTSKPQECPPVQCPPGYQAALTSPRRAVSDIPPPRARRPYYARYTKGVYSYRKGGYGTKGGFSKGGFSKGGFSKGGFVPPSPPQTNQAFTLDKPSITPTATPAKEACPQFKCIPRVPPFPKPGSTPAPVVCSVVSCPSGYTLRLETLAGFNRCPQYECVPPPERPVYCNVTGRTFNTFDGTEYKYDVCFHILARENRFDSWTVLLRKKCRDDGCRNELLVHQDDQLILVKSDLMIEYNNYEYTVEQTAKICFQKNSFDVARLGSGVLIKSRRYNFTVIFTKEGDAKIGVLDSLKGRVDGLCGSFDGIRSNDRQLPTGRAARSIDEFGRAWARPGLRPDACTPRVVPPPKQKRVWEMCDVITKEPFSRCAGVLDLAKWRSICLEKVCECTELVVNGSRRSEEQCRCELLQQLAAECLAAAPGIDLPSWRVNMHCPADCPAPLVHYDCYRKRCEPSCAGTDSGAGVSCPVEEGQCFPGCYCPEGTLRKGDACVLPADCLDCTCNGVGSPAKYVTFEGDDLPYLGNCTYLASRDRNDSGQHKYEVFATNGPCEDKPSVSCVKALHLVYENNVIHISKDITTKKLVTRIGEKAVYKYPVKKAWGSIALSNGQDITITLPDIHVELTVLQSKLEFTVRVPSYLYANKTEGLCGICAGDLELLLTSYGNQTENFDEYGKSWQATPEALTTLQIPPQEQCDQPPPPLPCTAPPPASNPCYTLHNADKFGECHALVDPAPFVESCEADLCENITDVCGTLERYAAACRRQGVCLSKWRNDLCPYPCDSPLVYRPCVACEMTCGNSDELTANPDKCDKQPVEGCFCPEGKVRVNNTCIEPEKCFPCDANKEHYAGDEWQEDACTKCTCSKVAGSNKAHVSCSTQACSTPVCGAGEELLSQPAACCPTYVCVPKPKVAECVEPKKMECGFGQILKQRTTEEGCPEFFCECKPPSECESIPSESEVEMFEPGVERVVDNSGCCPKLDLVCKKDKCPGAPACPQFHDLSVRNVSGKCCPEYECELPKNKCLVKLEWESSPAGGEVQKKIPEVLFKDVDATWSDGPCRTCSCRAGSVAACTARDCPPPPADSAFVLRARPVPFACCPDVEQVACRDGDVVYEVGQNWTSPDDVCAIYKCVENNGALEKLKTVQTCDKKCQPGWEYTPPAPSAKQCCGRCEPVACVVHGIEHPIGDKWTSKDHCTNYTCVNVNGTLQIQSSNETCPEVSEALRKQFVLTDDKEAGKCCRRQEPIACRVGNKIYQEGQTWVSSDPCRNVTCSRDVSGRLTHSESVTACDTECRVGWAYSGPAAGECCGRCEQQACVIGDQLRKPGETWQSRDNCTSFSCERAGAEVFVTSSRETCPDVSRCAPQHLVNDSCCVVCKEPPENLSTCVAVEKPSRDTVELFRVRVGSAECVNKQPVRGFRECRGKCDSGALYDTARGVHESKCECCAARQFSKLTVTLSCSDGSTRPHQVASPVTCACDSCGEGTLSKPSTKSPGRYGAKTAPKPSSQEDADFIPDIFKRLGEE